MKKHMYASGFPWKNSKVINGMIIRLHSGKNAEAARRRGAGRERRKTWELMQKYRGNKSRIAEELGISRCTLYKKLRRYAF